MKPAAGFVVNLLSSAKAEASLRLGVQGGDAESSIRIKKIGMHS